MKKRQRSAGSVSFRQVNMKAKKTVVQEEWYSEKNKAGWGTLVTDDPQSLKILVQDEISEAKKHIYDLKDAPGLTCIDLEEYLCVCEDPQRVLNSLSSYCAKTGADLVFAMPNAYFGDRIVDQFILDSVPSTKRAMTLSAIEKMLEKSHFQIQQVQREYAEKTRVRELARVAPDLADKVNYFSDLTADRNNIQKYIIRCSYAEGKQKSSPFLSVIIRTRGDRLQELKEVFLCLNSQSSLDFEVLIMMHNVAEEKRAEVESLIEFVADPLQDKVGFVPVEGGTRATPLNRAIELVQGKYFAMLDDDDLVLANWVEAFETGAKKAKGKIIHTYAVTQDWARHGADLRTESEKESFYCNNFDWDIQYRTNRCPFMTLAFPTAMVHRLKYRFDEALNTVEDWDFLMKVATVTDVYDVPQCSAIYRKWVNAENSTTLFDEKQRKRNEILVRKDFNQLLKIEPVDAYDSEEGGMTGGKSALKKKLAPPKLEPEIRFGTQVHNADIFNWHGENVVIRFEHPFVVEKRGRARLDPFIYGGFILKTVTIYCFYEDGTAEKYEGKRIKTNGLRRGGKIYFLFSDPQLYFDLPAGKSPAYIEVVCTRSNEILMRTGISLLPRAYLNLIWQTLGYPFRKVAAKLRK